MSSQHRTEINDALDYHALPTPGKISIQPTKSLDSPADLALAYSPGVAYASQRIAADPAEATRLTSRSNLVAVVTNGTAVLGLGDIGPLAAKPVMEGKAALFKKFADIDAFDIELDEKDPDALVDTIARMEPTFGGINLEDIKAPECFEIEARLVERMRIPVFHDDQHGTAVVAAAAILNALTLVGKDLNEVRLICSGAGAAAIACLDLLQTLGIQKNHITLCDSQGVVHRGRGALHPSKRAYARETNMRDLAQACIGADIFLGLSGAGVLSASAVASMARDPIILALANPTPEILPELALQARPDAIVGTGRSDYPNQINNVLCFPFLFRGALDSGATRITEAMKIAAVRSLAALAREAVPDAVIRAYGGQHISFGRDYLIPKPLDARLLATVAPEVAQAAQNSGVATRKIDVEDYRRRLEQRQQTAHSLMNAIRAAAQQVSAAHNMPVALVDGEDERVLQAAQILADEGIARPLLVGRAKTIRARVSRLMLRMQEGEHFEIIDQQDGNTCRRLADEYLALQPHMPEARARLLVANRAELVGPLLVASGRATGQVGGLAGDPAQYLEPIKQIIGPREGGKTLAMMQMLMVGGRQIFIADTEINPQPPAEQVAEIAQLAAECISRMGLEPRLALVSHSDFGSVNTPSARKMERALELIRESRPGLKVDGEMQAGTAIGQGANLLVMPNLDAANIAFNLTRSTHAPDVSMGGFLLGAAMPAHVLPASASVDQIVDMTAMVVLEAAGVTVGARHEAIAADADKKTGREGLSQRHQRGGLYLVGRVARPLNFARFSTRRKPMNQKIALVTGGMGGLGQAISIRLAQGGYRVVVTHSPGNTNVQRWLEEKKQAGHDITAVECDVADLDSCRRAAADVIARLGSVDILVNNSGITRDTTFRKMDKAGWDAVMHTNLDSLFNVTKQFLDFMVEKGWGRIINISSVNGSKGAFGQTNYSAAKAGVHGFTKALALEVATKGVTVNTISPGYIGTPMVAAIAQPVLESKILPQIPMGRLGRPEEVAGLVAYLASEEAGFMTGANLAINGGQHMN